jgi:hypothetical protein
MRVRIPSAGAPQARGAPARHALTAEARHQAQHYLRTSTQSNYCNQAARLPNRKTATGRLESAARTWTGRSRCEIAQQHHGVRCAAHC